MKTTLAAAVTLLVAGTFASAHRLDEYLQGALIAVESSRLQTQLTLTPGVAVLPAVLAGIDTDADGVLSETEQRAYAARVLRDIPVTMDGHPLTVQLGSFRFPAIEDLRDGNGEIQIVFSAGLPLGGPNRRLIFKNHHQSQISAYQVNALLPRDPKIRIVSQTRNYAQSIYEMEYVQSSAWWSGDLGWLGAVALLLSARFAWLWRRRAERKNAVEPDYFSGAGAAAGGSGGPSFTGLMRMLRNDAGSPKA